MERADRRSRSRRKPAALNVDIDYKQTRPELKVEIDRDRAGDLGVSVEEIGRTLEALLGARFVTTFVRGGKEYNVVVQARAEDRTNPGDLNGLYVRSRDNGAVDRAVELGRL